MSKTIVALAVWLVASVLAPSLSSAGTLRLHVIRVGQGDGLVLQCPDDSVAMIVDSADTREKGDSGLDAWKRYVYPLLDPVTPIPLVVASHPHADHIGGLDWLLRTYKIGLLVDNGRPPKKSNNKYPKTYRNYEAAKKLLAKSKKKKATTSVKSKTLCGDVVTVKYFVAPGFSAANCRSNPNECSVVLRVEYGDTSFLLTGDAEHKAEENILKTNKLKALVDVDVLKAGHHGSHTSSTKEFLEAASPQCVIISSGEHTISTTNKGTSGYRHPRKVTIDTINEELDSQPNRAERVWAWGSGASGSGWSEELVKSGVSVTALDGDVVVQSDGNRVLCR